MQTIGQAWLVLVLTHSGWQLGLVGALQALPILLFSLFGGVFADRWPKRRVLLVTQTAALLRALLLWALLATGTVQIWHIYVLAMLLGLTNSPDMPTRQAFVVELVGREDLDYIWKTPTILLIILAVGLVLLFGSNFNVLLPLFATDVLHVGATGFGFLSAALGVGALISALWMAWGNNAPTLRRVLIGTLVFGILEVVFAVSRIYLLSLALIASVGFTETAFAFQGITLLQTVAPDVLRGRVMSVQVLFFDGSLPLGYLLMGWPSGFFGAPSAMLVGALLSLLIAGAGWIWFSP